MFKYQLKIRGNPITSCPTGLKYHYTFKGQLFDYSRTLQFDFSLNYLHTVLIISIDSPLMQFKMGKCSELLTEFLPREDSTESESQINIIPLLFAGSIDQVGQVGMTQDLSIKLAK